MKPWTVECKECGETAVREKEPGLYECLACGRMFNKKPITLPPKVRKDWKRK